jgi:hypothetical protein
MSNDRLRNVPGLMAVLGLACLLSWTVWNVRAQEPGATARPSRLVPDPKQTGGEPDSVVQVANLVYAGVKSSQCFADHFLVAAEKETTISTSRRFHAVKLDSEEIYGYPLLIMTGGSSPRRDRLCGPSCTPR